MVFWESYPVLNTIYSLFTTRFKSLIFDKSRITNPVNTLHIITYPSNVTRIRDYLKKYFGNLSKPVLDIPEIVLLNEKDIIFVLEHNDSIVGTIRYHYMGIYKNKQINTDIYCVDCFCIHPEWRKKGLADFLLSELHYYANKKGIPYCMFLKEGHILPIIHLPIYSSTYVYRKIKNTGRNMIQLSTDTAYRLIDIFTEFRELFIIKNKKLPQTWKLYKNGLSSILICIQNTYQLLQGKTMGWITAWIESPCVTDSIRKDASEQITADFDYIWMNQAWIGDSTEWTIDGDFHWYSYQWSTSINRSYCILT